MVIVTKTLSKTRSVFSVISTFVVVAAGFLAILFSSRTQKLTFVSLVTGTKVAHADYLGGDATDAYDGSSDASSDASTDASSDASTDGGSGPDGASEGAADGSSADGSDGK